MNTRNLKSNKLIKLLKNAGLVKAYSTMHPTMRGKAYQVKTTEIDLLYRQVCRLQKGR